MKGCSAGCSTPVERCSCSYKVRMLSIMLTSQQCFDCWLKSTDLQCPNCNKPYHVVITEIGSYVYLLFILKIGFVLDMAL